MSLTKTSLTSEQSGGGRDAAVEFSKPDESPEGRWSSKGARHANARHSPSQESHTAPSLTGQEQAQRAQHDKISNADDDSLSEKDRETRAKAQHSERGRCWGRRLRTESRGMKRWRAQCPRVLSKHGGHNTTNSDDSLSEKEDRETRAKTQHSKRGRCWGRRLRRTESRGMKQWRAQCSHVPPKSEEMRRMRSRAAGFRVRAASMAICSTRRVGSLLQM